MKELGNLYTKVNDLYTEVSVLNEFAVMCTNSKFKSIHAQSFTSGMEYAFRYVMKIIEEKFKEENERKEVKQ